MKKVFITKYALTWGIIEKETQIKIYKSPIEEAIERVYVEEWPGYPGYTIGREAFYTLEEALKEAEEMRKKKIASLRKQIKKLEKMEFNCKKR